MASKNRPRAPRAALVIVLSLAIILSACAEDTTGQGDGATTTEPRETTTQPGETTTQPRETTTQPAAPDEVVTLGLGNIFDASHPFNECGVATLIDEVASASGGTIIIENFPGGQLGGQGDLFDLVDSGNLDLTIMGSAVSARRYAPIGVLNAAFLFNSVSQMLDVVNGDLGAQLWSGLAEQTNLQVLGSWYNGARHVTTSDVEVRHPDDLSGLKIRAVDTPITIANVDALGGNPVPLAFGELYLGLQQGTVDGQENPIPTIRSQAFDEVQDFITLTGHVIQSTQILVSDVAWEKLSSDQQAALKGAITVAGDAAAECVLSAEESILEEWKTSSEINVIEDFDRAAFVERAEAFWPVSEFWSEWDELYEAIKASG